MSRVYEALKRAAQEREEFDEVDSDMRRSGESRSRVEVVGAQVDEVVALPAGDTSSLPIRADRGLAEYPETSWRPDPNALLFLGGDETGRAAEEFRALRTRLYQLRERQTLKSVLITSALAREGKSFVAANLAQVLALQAGCRVLVIDADLREPRLHSLLGTSATPGLTEYLLEEREEFEIMQRGKADNFFFMPSGREASGPTELVASSRFKSMITRLETLFDWIVIDSPPATPVSDACALADCCDGVLMVVRANSTPFDVVRKGLERFPEESLLGVVLNEIESAGRRSTERLGG